MQHRAPPLLVLQLALYLYLATVDFDAALDGGGSSGWFPRPRLHPDRRLLHRALYGLRGEDRLLVAAVNSLW
jgi:hypothetical protein